MNSLFESDAGIEIKLNGEKETAGVHVPDKTRQSFLLTKTQGYISSYKVLSHKKGMFGLGKKYGSVYGVYKLGDKIVDPYTGESLGAEETEIATIRIVDVKPKYAVAEIVTGDISEVRVGQICRPKAETRKKEGKKEAESQPAPKQKKKPMSEDFENEW